jgi:hypothetical protein
MFWKNILPQSASSTLKMEAVNSTIRSENFYQPVQCHIFRSRDSVHGYSKPYSPVCLCVTAIMYINQLVVVAMETRPFPVRYELYLLFVLISGFKEESAVPSLDWKRPCIYCIYIPELCQTYYVNILCTYWLTIYWQKTDPTSRHRSDPSGTALTRASKQ